MASVLLGRNTVGPHGPACLSEIVTTNKGLRVKKLILVSALSAASIGSLVACQETQKTDTGSESTQAAVSKERPFLIAKCVSSEAEIGSDRLTLTLNAVTDASGNIVKLTGDYFRGFDNGNESMSAKLATTGRVTVAASPTAGYEITLAIRTLEFGDDSEGGSRTVKVPKISMDLDPSHSRISLNIPEETIGGCTFTNTKLLDLNVVNE
jgi:hypothetical protein